MEFGLERTREYIDEVDERIIACLHTSCNATGMWAHVCAWTTSSLEYGTY